MYIYCSGAFRHSLREQYAPQELFCNSTTQLCDGFDARSNVWGAVAAVLPVLLGGRAYAPESLPSFLPDVIIVFILFIAKKFIFKKS